MPANSNTASPAEPGGGVNDPAFWQARYEQGDTPWDKPAAHPALTAWLQSAGRLGRVLVPGCGTGRDAAALAAHARAVDAIDIAPQAIRRALAADPPSNLRFHLLNLFQLPPDWRGAFDWVFEHTCFCAMDPASRADYVRAARAALKPDGRIFGVFFLDPDNDDEGPPFGVSRSELDALFSPDFRIESSWIPAHTFEGREQREEIRILTRKPHRGVRASR